MIEKNILVTGAKGFVGLNLVSELKNRGFNNVFEYDLDSTIEELESYCSNADFVFHLAGVNRPLDIKEFKEGNFGFTNTLLETLKKYNNKCPILLSSSIQATLDNPYGISKKDGEDLLLKYGKENNSSVYIYRFTNLFGKWSRPNYNSVIATFCHNVANDLPIQVNNENTILSLVYIDDVVDELISTLTKPQDTNNNYYEVKPSYDVTLGEIAETIRSFNAIRKNNELPDFGNEFTKKLHATYLSFLPEDDFIYDLKMNVDNRGSFTEFLRTPDRGQVSINISKPGITKGNHWHHTKNEKFLVVSGTGIIRFRKVGTDKIIEYKVSGDKLQVLDIPVGYTHNIENIGENDMVTVMWVNESFDPNKPDTIFEEV